MNSAANFASAQTLQAGAQTLTICRYFLHPGYEIDDPHLIEYHQDVSKLSRFSTSQKKSTNFHFHFHPFPQLIISLSVYSPGMSTTWPRCHADPQMINRLPSGKQDEAGSEGVHQGAERGQGHSHELLTRKAPVSIDWLKGRKNGKLPYFMYFHMGKSEWCPVSIFPFLSTH